MKFRTIPVFDLSLAATTLVAVFLLAACQSPTETPPTTERNVTVHVQDANGASMELVPVEMHELADGEAQLLETDVTDASGNARFQVEIPTTGRAFRFIIGDARVGKIFVDANLLCRDTVLLARLAAELLPCGESVSRTLRIEDICAPLRTGQTFSDSTQYTFSSTCDEALSFTLSGPPPGEFTLVILGTDGTVLSDRPFTIPPRGQFVVRAIATPADSGLRRASYIFNGAGANGATATLNLDVEVDARNCNVCECPEEEIIVDFGLVEAFPTRGEGVRVIELPRNLCNFLREDNLIKGASQPDFFGVPEITEEMVPPGRGYTRRFTFTPQERNYDVMQDTILIEHWIADESKACTTRVILRGQGCGPACELLTSRFTLNENVWDYELGRVRVYESGQGEICVRHTGECGTLVITKSHGTVPGFSISPETVSIEPGERACFTVTFDAADEVVWPLGHGQPADINHEFPLKIQNCEAEKSITVKVRVDTLPAQFSRCIYQWDQNGKYGYNFTPVQGKGEDHYDPDKDNNQTSDIVVEAVSVGFSADVRIRGRWKLIKSAVSETQFNFDDMSKGLNGWTLAEYRGITTGAFNNQGQATLQFRSVYSVEVIRGTDVYYACVRVREVSADPDGKFKMCLDVLFPMIKE
ncbi:MAG: hypothetical protein RBU27_07270 [Bacteroidota bacterium]|jgi:hypothetical protein|nr:hypothetical protein [Bacteroidota bacterium]